MRGRRGGRGGGTSRGIPVRGSGRARGFGRGRGPSYRQMTYPTVKLKLTHKAKKIHVEAPANATFGDLKVCLRVPSARSAQHGVLLSGREKSHIIKK